MKCLVLLCAATFAFLPCLPAAIKRDPNEALRSSQEAFEKRDFDKATELLTEALKANPDLDSVFAAYATHKNYWRYTAEGWTRLAPDLATYRPRQSRSDLIYREDAGLASASRAAVIRAGRRLGDRVDVVPTADFRTGIDIHTAFDFWLAEKILTEWSGTRDE